jgi:hypothetical protein
MKQKTRKQRKTRRQRRKSQQRGGLTDEQVSTRTPYIVELFNPEEKPLTLKDFILNRRNKPNNGNYTWYKYTIIPAGTIFHFRSKQKLTALEERTKESKKGRGAMWVDYTETLGKPSFQVENPGTNAKIPRAMAKHFGPWLNTIRTLKPLTILHFPVDYTHIRPENIHSYTSEFERVISRICADLSEEFDPNAICADGYTLDFLHRTVEFEKPPFNNVDYLIENFRELAILNPKPGETVEFISSEHVPIE